jgi:hypothetical protein
MPAEDLVFTLRFSLDHIDDKEAALEEVLAFLGLRLRNLPDVMYPLKLPAGTLMTPQIPTLHQYWVALEDLIERSKCSSLRSSCLIIPLISHFFEAPILNPDVNTKNM